MNRSQFALGMLLILTTGCAVTANPQAIGPFPDGYKEVIKAHILRTFYDPYSIRSALLSYPTEGHLFFRQGWIVCFQANAKNRMGGSSAFRDQHT